MFPLLPVSKPRKKIKTKIPSFFFQERGSAALGRARWSYIIPAPAQPRPRPSATTTSTGMTRPRRSYRPSRPPMPPPSAAASPTGPPRPLHPAPATAKPRFPADTAKSRFPADRRRRGCSRPLPSKVRFPSSLLSLSHSWHRGIEQPSWFLKMGARTPLMRGDASRLESLGHKNCFCYQLVAHWVRMIASQWVPKEVSWC
jgi:hypothetical protein